MWISNGDHDLTENIVHLVLAKIPDADGRLVPGVKGISLFIVPKFLVDKEGQLTVRNDVALAGLNHKCGWRGTVNTLLNFGEGLHPVEERSGAVGYRVGAVGEGLKCMFHMMNEARIGVGLAATMLGMAGYEASLAYARQRPQGRPMGPSGKDAAQPQVPIIEHADVRRMLLAQKSAPDTIRDVIAQTNSSPGQYNYAHAGDGTSSHLAGEMFKSTTGADLTPVPFKAVSMIKRSNICSDASFNASMPLLARSTANPASLKPRR